MKAHHSSICLLLLVAILLTACGSGATSMPTDTAVIPTDTEPPPSATITPTLTATATDTPSPSPTATQGPASLTLNQDTYCRTGPRLDYAVEVTLPEGSEWKIIGRNEDDTWWQVETDWQYVNCWIADSAVTTSGALAALPLVYVPLPTVTASPEPEGRLIYFILVDSYTEDSCEYRLIGVDSGVRRSLPTADGVRDTLRALFNVRTEYYLGLYNPLYRSIFRVAHVNFVGGHAEVQLQGNASKPDKDKCFNSMVIDQVHRTIAQFSEVKSFKVRLGTLPFEDFFSNDF
jgi:hypothetical protein